MEKDKKILVALGEKKVLKEIFNTSFYTVRNALNGDMSKNTVLGLKIRLAALDRGGLEVEPTNKNNEDTIGSGVCTPFI